MISGVPSSVKLQMNTIVPPANRPGMISGSVMRKNRFSGGQPRFAAASSIAGSMFASAAATLRYRIG